MTAAATQSTERLHTVNLKTIRAAMDAIRGSCPIRRYMIEKGFNPDEGCKLILPSSMAADNDNLPNYVKFSKFIPAPLLIRGLETLL
jgi:hypothetical protein